MLETNRRHFCEIEPLRRLQPAMSRYDPVRLVDQNWGVEAERFNAAGDRTDVLRGMLSRIVGIRNNGLDRLPAARRVAILARDRATGDEQATSPTPVLARRDSERYFRCSVSRDPRLRRRVAEKVTLRQRGI
jgi:hypothetical protein